MQEELEENFQSPLDKQENSLTSDVPLPENTKSEGHGRIRTEYDEQGRSWAVIDGEWKQTNQSEWIGGIPDTWKRR